MFEEKTTAAHVQDTCQIASSTFYKKLEPKSEDKRVFNKGRPTSTHSSLIQGGFLSNFEVVERIRELRMRSEFQNAGGYIKMSYYLRNFFGIHVNKKKVFRLCKENGLLLSRIRKKKIQRPTSINRTIVKPMRLWELDIKYGYATSEGRFFFIMTVLDVYLRLVVGYHVGLRCLGRDLVRTLALSFEEYKIGSASELVVRMDNGPQMTSKQMLSFASSNRDKMVQEFIPVATPNKNAHIESFNSILEIELFQTGPFETYIEGYERVARFMEFYQRQRVHSSLGYRTPQQCYDLYLKGELKGIEPVRV